MRLHVALAFALFFFGSILFLYAQVPMTGAGLGVPYTSGGANNTALDGTGGGTGTTSAAGTLTTAHTNDIIIAYVLGNADNPASTTVSGGSLTWHQRACSASGPTCGSTPVSQIEEWYAIASSTLSSATITAANTGTTYLEVGVYGISGANTSSPFDGNASIPGSSATTPVTVSTSNANDFIACMERDSSTNPFPTSGWTNLHTGSFGFSQYQRPTTTQSGLSCTAATSNGMIVDAAKSS